MSSCILTLGGNDADFVRIIGTAAKEKDSLMRKGKKRTLNEQLDEVWGRFWEEGGIRQQLHDAYNQIARLTGFDPETKTGGAHIIVVGCPQLLYSNASPHDGDILFTRNEANTINGNVHSFNEHILSLMCFFTIGFLFARKRIVPNNTFQILGTITLLYSGRMGE